jgi:hypothetical protein
MKHETDAARIGVEAAVAVRRGGKQRGAYLQWLDEQLNVARKTKGADKEHQTLQKVRKAFTDEFYPK